ncbi:MAG: hypothetical protein F6K54_21465 [Okeania sp. SIO3B5]|nr:hypothetical protein [Okeania sp. SIO3B5]NEO55410.1 hypothetical protein [Okeania sp. SIO3B5]
MGIEPTQLVADSSHTPLKNYGVRLKGGLAKQNHKPIDISLNLTIQNDVY